MNNLINNGFRGLSNMEWPQLRALISPHHIAPVFRSLPILSGALDVMWNYIDLTSSFHAALQ